MKYGLNAASRLYSALATSVLLAACGSGGGDSQPAVPSDTVRIACQVSDAATNKPVAGATVDYQTSDAAGTNKAYTTTTNADGSCTLDLPASEVAGVTFPAASVTATGYEPQTIPCPKLQGGQACVTPAIVELIPLAANVSIPEGGDVVMHVGDDLFGGTINSQFQKKPDGTELNFKINDWATQVGKAGITKATVVLDAKGWQTVTAPGCKNVIELVGDAGKMTLQGGDSPANGSWGGGHQAPFVFTVAQVGTASATLRIAGGTCGNGTDVDDFETNRIRVYYCGAESVDCIPR